MKLRFCSNKRQKIAHSCALNRKLSGLRPTRCAETGFNQVFTILQLCYWLLEDVCGSKPEGFLPSWNITLPDVPQPPPQLPTEPEPNQPTTRFLFFTDMHIDLEYKPGGNAVCGEPLCCRSDDTEPSNRKYPTCPS